MAGHTPWIGNCMGITLLTKKGDRNGAQTHFQVQDRDDVPTKKKVGI